MKLLLSKPSPCPKVRKSPCPSPYPPPVRLALFTDTLGDVNGVSRFLCTLAADAHRRGLPLRVITSTTFPVPDLPTIVNIKPRFTMPIPRYPQLHFALPHRRALAKAADDFHPTHVHVSTPGPVGLVGRAYALNRRLPFSATYHTDFPAYIQHLFQHESLTALTEAMMRWFYTPARTVFSRSADYAKRLRQLGIPDVKLAQLRPGIDLGLFRPPSPGSAGDRADGSEAHGSRKIDSFLPSSRRFGRADEGAFQLRDRHAKHPHPNPLPKSRENVPDLTVLYVGRISIEKNLPFLTALWPRAHAALKQAGVRARLIVAGEGPYAGAMRQALAHHDAQFPGVLRGRPLADLYASADLFTFPSTTDTLGQAVMEAQACGLPCLISPIGGPREVVLHDRTALVLPIKPAAWHDAIVTLGTDHARRKEMALAAAAHGATFPFTASADQFWAVHANEPEAPARVADEARRVMLSA